jgi:phosphoribosylpyrophosphate synthetase
VTEGIGSRVLPCLERVKPIPKSAFAALGSRPKLIDHYESMGARKMVVGKEVLCLVDDVITKGATMLAAASRLQEMYPDARVIAFALVRTTGFVEDIERIIDPVVGSITLHGDDVHRQP